MVRENDAKDTNINIYKYKMIREDDINTRRKRVKKKRKKTGRRERETQTKYFFEDGGAT